MAVIKYEIENDGQFETKAIIKQDDNIVKLIQHNKINDCKNEILLSNEQVKELYLKLFHQ